MGLRFRKSISLGKGIRLNFGKSGASISVGRKGYRKTINTKGQVTTTIGIPGTGIYYTDKKSLKKSDSSRSISNRSQKVTDNYENSNMRLNEDITSTYQMNSDVEKYFVSSSNESVVEDLRGEQIEYDLNSVEDEVVSVLNITISDIQELYKDCDDAVDWTEILVSISADDLYMNKELWDFYKSVADKILSGDIATYLHVIEVIRPLDDLMLYGGDFEFDTDDETVMEIEFDVMPEDVLGENCSEDLLQEYVSACVIRVARDIMALLPVQTVKVNAVLDNRTLLAVDFDKATMLDVDFDESDSAVDIINIFKK